MAGKLKRKSVEDLAARMLARYARQLHDSPEVCFDDFIRFAIQEVYETYDDRHPVAEAAKVINNLILDLSVLIYEIRGDFKPTKNGGGLASEEVVAAAEVLEMRYWNKRSGAPLEADAPSGPLDDSLTSEVKAPMVIDATHKECGTCRCWRREKGTLWGKCAALAEAEAPMEVNTSSAESGPDLRTRNYFGCTQWRKASKKRIERYLMKMTPGYRNMKVEEAITDA